MYDITPVCVSKCTNTLQVNKFSALILFLLVSLSLRAQLVSGCYYVSDKNDSTVIATGRFDTVNVYPTPAITIKDFKKVTIIKDNWGYSLEITLTTEGGLKFENATDKWNGKRLAIILDGSVEMAPIIKEKITGGVLRITANFTKKEATALKKSLQKEMKK